MRNLKIIILAALCALCFVGWLMLDRKLSDDTAGMDIKQPVAMNDLQQAVLLSSRDRDSHSHGARAQSKDGHAPGTFYLRHNLDPSARRNLLAELKRAGGLFPAYWKRHRQQDMTQRGTAVFLVQFDGRLSGEVRQDLQEHDMVVRGYIPPRSYLVECTPEQLQPLAAFPDVTWLSEYLPEDKLHPDLRAGMGEAVQDIVFQSIHPDDGAALESLIEKAGGEVISSTRGKRWARVRAKVPQEELIHVAFQGAVRWIEPFYERTLLNDVAVKAGLMNVTNVWETYSLTGSNQIVAHADTGIDVGTTNGIHPDFAGQIYKAFALGRPGDWSDPHGHGTHSGGSILGSGAGSSGQIKGAAYGAKLLHQSVMDSGGGLGGLPLDLFDLYIQAYTNGARIHSDSWGSDVYGQYTTDSQSTDEFQWDYPDMLIVYSAGNAGTDADDDGVVDLDSIGSPATAKNIVTVGASESSRSSGGYSSYAWGALWSGDYGTDPIKSDKTSTPYDGTHLGVAAFSSRGPTDDGRMKPDILAPGVNILSCRSHEPGAGTGWGAYASSTNYSWNGGTSMACPLAAGAAALVREYYQTRRNVAQPSAALVKATLLVGADSLFPGQYGTGSVQEIPSGPRPNPVEGWGQIDMEETLFSTSGRHLYALNAPESLATGSTNVHWFYLDGTNAASFLMTYSDYPAELAGSQMLVNDLDMVITGPTGEIFYAAGGVQPDRTNNLEGIEWDVSTPGLYKVEIRGWQVPMGPQPYALAVLGPVAPFITHDELENTAVTTGTYSVRASVDSAWQITNDVYLFWTTNSFASGFITNEMTHLSNGVFEGLIPAQSNGTVVSYYIEATDSGYTGVSPMEAPGTLYSFSVVGPVLLSVTGTPVLAGSPEPAYGSMTYASGAVVSASAELYTESSNLFRYALAGWTGQGSVPPSGATNSVSIILEEDSVLEWVWSNEWGVAQSSSPVGLIGVTNWYYDGTTGHTLVAEDPADYFSSAYRFAYWQVDGVRQPDASSPAVNPVDGIMMTTSRQAVAVYLAEDLDADGDGMDDWWEQRYFGDLDETEGLDPDSDGYINLMEFKDGTSPQNGAEHPVPPVIQHDPLSNPIGEPAPWQVEAVVTDNYAVASVVLYWRESGDGWTQSAMTNQGGNVYAGEIPAPGTNGMTFEYRVYAEDEAGYSSSTQTQSFDVAYPVLSFSPGSFSTTMLSNAVGVYPLVITNTGLSNLNVSISVAAVGYVYDMESGTNGWSHSGTNDSWHLSDTRTYSGTNAWYNGEAGFSAYPNASHAMLEMPPVLIPPNASMRYQQWFDGELYYSDYTWDGGMVEISTNDGATYSPLTPEGGYPYKIYGHSESPWPEGTRVFSGTGSGWDEVEFDLSAFAGETVLIRFHFGSDFYTVEEGWYIDDVSIVPGTGTNGWISLSQTQAVIGAASGTNVGASIVTSNLVPSRDLYAFIQMDSNDPVTPVQRMGTLLQLRARPELTMISAAQVSTNGSGKVELIQSAHDVDGDALQLAFYFAESPAALWHTAYVESASASVGSLVVTQHLPQVLYVATTNGAGGLVTNTVSVVWATQEDPVLFFSTQAVVKARAWDGLFWSATVTGSPFLVDNVPPDGPDFISSSTHDVGIWSASTNFLFSWDAASDSNGVGVAGYSVVLTNTAGAAVPEVAAQTLTSYAVAVPNDGTNWMLALRSVDQYGNAGGIVTSGPYRADITPPDISTAQLSIASSAFGDYSFSTVITSFWSGIEDAASGLDGCFVTLTGGGLIRDARWTGLSSLTLEDALVNASNLVEVWAVDEVGNTADSLASWILVIDGVSDQDQDGFSNSEEELAGTDALSSDSIFESVPAMISTGAVFQLKWPYAAGREYEISWADFSHPTNTLIWQSNTLSDVTVDNGWAVWRVTNAFDAMPTSTRFYRVRVSYP